MVSKQKMFDIDYKVLIIGESRVGKTSILKRLSNQTFTENTISTVGIDFVNLFVPIDGLTVRLQIWDTAGQERFRTITKSYFRNSKGIVLVYDMTCKESFEKLEYWIESLSLMKLDTEVIYLIGNKNDLQSEREISYEQGHKFANRNLIKFFEASAKTGENLNDIFNSLAFDILDLNDMSKMNRYKQRSSTDCFVYSYNMPSEIQLKEKKEIASKRRYFLPFKKKFKYKTPVARSLDQLNTINYNPVINFTNKRNNKKKANKQSNKKSSKDKLSLNCCKIS